MRYPLDWNDLRYFLAVARQGSLSRAARNLKVDPGTVSRRVSAMELALGIRCFERRPEGYPLTEQGEELLVYVERIEREIVSLDRAIDAAYSGLQGTVTVTTSETVARGFVLPSLVALRDQHPQLTIELISDNRVLSLARREVDIALRLARPEEGELLARRVGVLTFGLFASEAYLACRGQPKTLDDLANHALVDWVEDYPRAATAVWMRALTANNPPVLKINTSGERVAAANLGLGVVLLPYLVARDTDLCPVLPDIEIPGLEIWLLAHPETAKIPRVRAVMDFLAQQATEQSRRFTTLG